jgi:hypothetical protein
LNSVCEHVRSIDEAVCNNIDPLGDNRGPLSQNILLQIRNLVEAEMSADSDPTTAEVASILKLAT